MSNKFKDIDIKNRTDYFLSDIINIENLDLNNIKIVENSCKNVLNYYIGYDTIKHSKYRKIYGINPFYLIFRNVNGHFE